MTSQPFTSFVMFGAMRTGSNLLESYLNQYDGLMCHGELFQRSFIGTLGRTEFLGIDIEARNENPQRLLEAVRKANPKKITGFRMFGEHDQKVMETVLQDRFCAKIILTRDPVESFVSLQIALITKQWLVSDIAHRKEVQIHFDLEEYATYLKGRTAFYDKISDALTISEQPFFEIDYSMLGDVENINRLAAFIGYRKPKTWLAQPIKRQNPGTLASKISNIEEVRAALESPCLHSEEPPILTPVLESDTDTSRAYFCQNLPLAFGPQPAVPDGGVRKWLETYNKRAPENGYTSHRFAEWQAHTPKSVFFTVTRHPVARAYNAFMNKIFATSEGAYTAIRKDLEQQYGLILPQAKIAPEHNRAALERRGYGLEEHRINFKLFLIFVEANLGNKTKIRQDGKWQLQTEIIRRYQIMHPEVVVLSWENMQTGLRYLENRLDIPRPFFREKEEDPRFSFPLSDVYDAETEALTRAAYGADYDALNYGDL